MADRVEQEISLIPADRLRAAELQETEALSTPEISAPMLDVHAPHESVRTWKDFLIHIAAIAVGLLIALGLEQRQCSITCACILAPRRRSFRAR